jgi:hypothetical protein
MSSTGEQITHELPFMEVVGRFCGAVATSTSVEELHGVDIIDDYLYYNTAGSKTGGRPTYRIELALQEAQFLAPDLERVKHVRSERDLALLLFVRGVIQGKQVPTDTFPTVFSHVDAAYKQLGDPRLSADQVIKGQSRSVWDDYYGDPVVMRRAAEAYRPLGSPLRYGLMMRRVAIMEANK